MAEHPLLHEVKAKIRNLLPWLAQSYKVESIAISSGESDKKFWRRRSQYDLSAIMSGLS